MVRTIARSARLLCVWLLVLCVSLPVAASAADEDWSALHGDWELRIDGGGEIYFARLKFSPSRGGSASLSAEASYESEGRPGRVKALSIDAGFYVVEIETRQAGTPARGLFAFELVEDRLVGDVDFESGSGTRSYEFQGGRLGTEPEVTGVPTGGDSRQETTQTASRVTDGASPIEPPPSAEKRIRLRQGDGGYTAAVDTEVWAIAPSKPLDRQGTMTTDANNGGGESQVLMQFGGLIGEGERQVAEGSRVVSATLRVVVFDPGTTVYLHRVTAPWEASSTWDGMAAGVSVDGVEASPVRDGFNFGQINMDRQEVQFDVTQTVQAWADGEPNYGWVFVNTGGDGWDCYSSDWIEEDLRPSLEVVVTGR